MAILSQIVSTATSAFIMITYSLNSNFSIHYDHRNLIVQHKKLIIEIHGSRNDTTIYQTFYYYDEAGNRIRKMTYDTEDDSLKSDIIYSRDVSGRELAVYENNSLKQWNLFGLDNIGYMTGSDELRFYLKDHLGSVRVVTDDKSSVINCQDYDPWGYLLENRVYKSDESVYKFTSKERDEESEYDYFGARYYDARVGRWESVEPLIDKYPQHSPYSTSKNNPLTIKDIDGKDIIPIFFPDYEPESKGINFPVGHSAVLIVDNETGNVNYYEYGAYDEGIGNGIVRRSRIEIKGIDFSNIEFNENGKPTNESLNKVLSEIGGGKIEGAYIKTTKEETQKARNYLETKIAESDLNNKDFNPNRKKYNSLTNNCSSFVSEAVRQGGVFVPPHIIDIPTVVNSYFRIFHKNVEYEPNK